jgi:FtsP/CotA-like multicopper oxidase with cupredoxin domain
MGRGTRTAREEAAMLQDSGISRRGMLAAGGALAISAAMPLRWSGEARASGDADRVLVLRPANVPLVGMGFPETAVWTYNGGVPGPEIRVRQGERLRVVVENGLDRETTVHWHGIRLPNAMDGVPHVTQQPIGKGGRFVYEFDLPDAGTYWYHPHEGSSEQVGRGLYGPLIVEEREPIRVDRDVVWVLDDWRLQNDAQITGDFGNLHDISHNGRIGNTVTVNGRIPGAFWVRRGERIRLRLINVANARSFALDFAGHRPMAIAYDGQPVTPHELPGGRIVLGAAMRADLVIDMMGKPGERFAVTDRFYPNAGYPLRDIAYQDETLRDQLLEAPLALAANTMPEPVLAEAQRHHIVLGGGMMGGMAGAMVGGRQMDIRTMMHNGKAWAINGVAASGHMMEPLLTLQKGRTHVFVMENQTAWHHPMHLHGHSFRVIRRNGRPTAHSEWRDTVLLDPRELVEVAFVADNPGNWMFHCHILEHQEGGMMGLVRVA